MVIDLSPTIGLGCQEWHLRRQNSSFTQSKLGDTNWRLREVR